MSDPTNERDASKYSIPELYQMIKKYNVEPPRTTTKKKLVKCYVENVIPLINKKQDTNNKKKRNASEIEENITIKKTRVVNQDNQDSDEDQSDDSYEDLDNNNMDDDNISDNSNNSNNNISDENVNKFVSPKNFSFENTITPINANKNNSNKSSGGNNNNNSFGEDRNQQIQKSQNNSNNNLAPKESHLINNNNSNNISTNFSSSQQSHSHSQQSHSQQTIHRVQSNEYLKQQRNSNEPKINYSSSSSFSQGSSILSQFNPEPSYPSTQRKMPTPPKNPSPNVKKITQTKRVVYEESDSSVEEGVGIRKRSDNESKILFYIFGPILLIFLFVFFFPEIRYNAQLLSASDPDYRAYLHSKNHIEARYGEYLCREHEDDGPLSTNLLLNNVANHHRTTFDKERVIQLLRTDDSLLFDGNNQVSFNNRKGTDMLPYVCRLKNYGYNYGVYFSITFFTLFVVFSYIA